MASFLAPVTPHDYVFDSCGRLVPPAGKAFMPLPRVIPMEATQAGAPPESTNPVNGLTVRMTNQGLTVFCALGIAVSSTDLLPSFQIRWPSGRYLNQNRTVTGENCSVPFPMGQNSRMLAFEKPLYMAPGSDVAVEVSSATGGLGGGNVQIQLWGYLLWLTVPRESLGAGVARGCLVGYPLPASSGKPSPVDTAIADLEAMPRYVNAAVGMNLLATETDLGNQCGYEGEPRVFSSDPVVLTYGQGVYNQRVICPFVGKYRLVGMRVRAIWSDDWDQSIPSDLLYAVRLPNGYGVMNSDMISNATVGFAPVFPSIPVQNQDRLIFDLLNFTNGLKATNGSVTAQIEFHLRRVN